MKPNLQRLGWFRRPGKDAKSDRSTGPSRRKFVDLRASLRALGQQLDSVPILRDAVLPAILVALYVWLGDWLGIKGKGNGSEIFGSFVAGVIGYYISYRLRMRGFQPSLTLLRNIADLATLSPARWLYEQMTHDQVDVAFSIVDGFEHDTYKVESPEQLQRWIDIFFRLDTGDYAAVDSHVPSRYWVDYSWFLAAHARSLKRRRESGQPDKDTRILAIEREELEDDWFNADTLGNYQRFVRWHAENKVDLRVISPADLLAIRKEVDIDVTDDVGFWGRFAVLFTSQRERLDGNVTMKLRPAREYKKSPDHHTINLLMDKVQAKSSPMSDEPPGVEMGDADLVSRWNDYIAPDVRWQRGGKYEKFILDVIPREANILDAATGSGIDSVNLLANGYSVTSNEVDLRLNEIATREAQRRGVAIEMRNARWEKLELAGNPRFDIVLVLGNSLCLVNSAERRRGALKGFYDILRPGGRLVIDERNYELIRRRRENILADPLRNWVNGVPDVMYPGRGLVGFPSSIADEEVAWSFALNEPTISSSTELLARAQKFQSLRLHAFQHGELLTSLKDAGFVVREIYADLEQIAVGPNIDSMPSVEQTSAAGFITYIAEHPK